MANVVQEIHSIEILTQGTAELTQLQTATRNTTRQINTLKKTTQTGFISRRGTAQIQNASFQIQDFLVQVGSGTSTLRAFSQQAPQFFSAWGPIGAAAGLAAAGVGLFFQTLQKAEEEASTATLVENTAALRQELEALTATRAESVSVTSVLGDQADAVQLAESAKALETLTADFEKMGKAAEEAFGLYLDSVASLQDAGQRPINIGLLQQNLGIDAADAKILSDNVDQVTAALERLQDTAGDEKAFVRGLAEFTIFLNQIGLEVDDLGPKFDPISIKLTDAAVAASTIADQTALANRETGDFVATTTELSEGFTLVDGLLAKITEERDVLQQTRNLKEMGQTVNEIAAELQADELQRGIKLLGDDENIEATTDEIVALIFEIARIKDEMAASEQATKDANSAMEALRRTIQGFNDATADLNLEAEIVEIENAAIRAGATIDEIRVKTTRARAEAELGAGIDLTGSTLESIRARAEIDERVAAVVRLNEAQSVNTELTKANTAATKAGGSAATDALREQEDAIRRWENLLTSAYENTRTPAEEAADQIEKLNAAFKGLSEAGVAIDGDMLQGFNRQMEELTDGTQEFSDSLEQAFGSGFTNLVDDVITSTDSITDAFNNMLSSILSDIADFLISQQITNFVGLLGNNLPSFGLGNAVSSAIGAGVSAFSGSPALAPANVGGGSYGSYSGSTSGLSVQPTVNITNNTPANVSASQGFDGRSLEIVVDNALNRSMANGGLDRAFQQNYGLRRTPT